MSILPNPDSPSLAETLRIMDVASALRREKELVEEQFDTEKSRAILREKLLGSAEVVGEQLTPEQVDAAIDWYYRNMYRFQEPPPNWELRLAHVYVHRWRWGSAVAAVLLAGAGMWWTLFSAASPFSSEYQLRKQVAAISHDINRRAQYIETNDHDQTAKTDLDALLTKVKTASSTRNLDELRQLSQSFDDLASRVRQENQLQERMAVTRATIDRHAASIRSMAKDSAVTQELDQTLKAVEAAQIRKDAEELDRLSVSVAALNERLQSNAKVESRIADATRAIDQHTASIAAISKDARAKEQADALAAAVAVEKTNRNVDELEKLAQSLAILDGRLKEEYTIDVVARSGQKSAVDRYYTDDKGKRISGYYLIVEAHDPSGNALSRRIRNSENGQVENVNKWAERVPQEIYERLKQDKISDGVLNETAFGAKHRGALEDEMLIKDNAGQPLKREAQITRW